MAQIITEANLASYLQTTIASGTAQLVIDLTNEIVSEELGTLLGSPPARVKAIALEVAARAWRNPKSLSSTTKSIDDVDLTERREGRALTAPGVYLLDGERAELWRIRDGSVQRRSRVGSIPLRVKSV